MSAENWKVKLWDAINEYAKACGGSPDRCVYGNTVRQGAVTVIESAIFDHEQETKLKLASAEARVKELEGLAIGSGVRHEGRFWLEVIIPNDRVHPDYEFAQDISTLGDAMPRKDGV